jgi:hypothetical protein
MNIYGPPPACGHGECLILEGCKDAVRSADNGVLLCGLHADVAKNTMQCGQHEQGLPQTSPWDLVRP